MRYLIESQIDLDVEIVERAEAIFERFLGHRLIKTEYTDTVKVGERGIILPRIPVVAVKQVKGRTSDFGDLMLTRCFVKTDWIDIPLEHIMVHMKDGKCALAVPQTIFGTAYTELEVTYDVGLTDAPEDVQKAIIEIAQMISRGQIDEWNCMLPVEIIDTIDRYRREV